MVYDHVGVTFFMNLRRRIWRVWRRRHTRRLLFCDVFGHPQIQMLWHSTYNSVAAASRRASSFRSESEIFGWSARAITFFGRRSGAIWKTPAFTEQSSRWLESEQISPTLKSYHYFKYYLLAIHVQFYVWKIETKWGGIASMSPGPFGLVLLPFSKVRNYFFFK